MNTAHKLFARWHIEVVEDVRKQNNIVTFAEVCFKRASRPEGDAIGYACGRRIFLCDRKDGSPVSRSDMRVRILLGNGDAKHSVPRSNIQHFARFPCFAPATSAINPADTVVRGAMVLAKVTQSSSFGLVLSPCATDVPPFLTDSVSASKFLLGAALTRKSAKVPIYAGECRLRKMADSCERV